MLRSGQAVALALMLLTGAAQLGCRACGSCYDYSPPVADCHCNACGGGRSGSALSHGYAASDAAGESGIQVAEQPAEPAEPTWAR